MTVYRFDQIAENIRVPVMPNDTEFDRYVGLEHLDPESLKLRRWGSPSDVIGQKLRFWKGDIIYGKRRAYQRKLAVADFEGICSAHAMVLRAKQDVILPELLPFFMQSEIFNQRAVEISVGSLSPTINWSTLAKQEFPLPPLDEQRRIADLLWTTDDEIESFRQLFDELCKLELATKLSVFSTSNHKVKLGSLIEDGTLSFKTGPFGTVLKASSYVQQGVPVVNPVNMIDGTFYVEDGPFISAKEAERLEIYKILEKDLIFRRKGEIGKGIFATKESEGYIFGSDCICVRVLKANIEPKYMFYFLTSPNSQRFLSAQAHGTIMPGINEKMLSRMEINIPDKEEQLEVINKFEQIDETKSQIQDRISKSIDLKRALLKRFLNY